MDDHLLVGIELGAEEISVAMVKIFKYALILTVLLAALAVGAGLAHGVEFDNWAAVAAFFYAAEVIGSVAMTITLLIFKK